MKQNSCIGAEELSAYLDADLETRRQQEIKEHLSSCKTCNSACEEMGAMKSGLLALGDVEPARDLWPAIQRERDRQAEASFAGWLRRFWMVPASALAGAAAAVLLMFVLMQPGGGPADSGKSPVAALQAVAKAEAEYRTAIGALETALESTRGDFSPETRQVVEQGLADINGTIEKCRKALKDNQHDPEAQDAMLAAYQYKVDFLTDLVAETL